MPQPAGFGAGDVSPTENTDVSTMITTGCGYDAWTGAVRRAVTDIDAPGAVSSHGLRVVPTYSSSTGIGWSLSWQWQIHGRPYTDPSNGGSYLVNFPDGRAVTFYLPSISGETAYRAGRGTKERLFINSPGSDNRSADLYMEDGSHVHFSWIRVDYGDDSGRFTDYFYSESFTDPYGQVTTLVTSQYDPNNSFNEHLTGVIDPSGRSLSYNYDPVAPGRLASITASTGQSATYTGLLDNQLSSVAYSDGTSAGYTYIGTTYKNTDCPGNYCPATKLFTATDVRAAGADALDQIHLSRECEFSGPGFAGAIFFRARRRFRVHSHERPRFD